MLLLRHLPIPVKALFAVFAFVLQTVSFTAHCADSVDTKTARFLDAFRESNTKSWLNGDVDSITSYYAADVWLMPEFQLTITGRENATLYRRAFNDRFSVSKASREKIEILDLGGQIAELGTFEQSLKVKATGQVFEIEGTYLDLWRHAKEGKPELVLEIWNYNKWYDGLDALMTFPTVPSVRMAFQPRAPIDSDISFEISALNHLLETVVTQHDADVWSHFYAEDAMLAPNHHPLYTGREAITDYLEAHVEELPIFEKLDIRSHRIDNLGKYVVVYSSHVANWRTGDTSGVGTGKNIRIMRRDDNHLLKALISVATYDYM